MEKDKCMTSEESMRLDRILGCMAGGAVGDALGNPVEFMDIHSIRKRYGKQGIIRYERDDAGMAVITDDTQMSLFTANGLLYGCTQEAMNNSSTKTIRNYIAGAYLEWYETQTGKKKTYKACWIRVIPELNNRRAPGSTCMMSLQSIHKGKDVMNNSKGCGGVMRVAPIALYPYQKDGSAQSAQEIAHIGAEAAEITHKHLLAIYPSAMLVHLIYRIINNPPDTITLEEIVEEALVVHAKDYPLVADYMKDLVYQAIQFSKEDTDDVIAIEKIGGGWTGDEAYAIAVYCALKYRNDFEKAVVAAVNHTGDSDSTGAITGNIMGALLGRKAIPCYYLENLELLPVIEELAHDLFTGCIISKNDPIDMSEKQCWYRKYVKVNTRDI